MMSKNIRTYSEVLTTPKAKLTHLIKGYLTSKQSQFLEQKDNPSLRKTLAKDNKDPNNIAYNITEDLEEVLKPYFDSLRLDFQVIERESDYIMVMQIVADGTTYDRSITFNERININNNKYLEAYYGYTY